MLLKFQFFIRIFTVEKLENKIPTFYRGIKMGVFMQLFQSHKLHIHVLMT